MDHSEALTISPYDSLNLSEKGELKLRSLSKEDIGEIQESLHYVKSFIDGYKPTSITLNYETGLAFVATTSNNLEGMSDHVHNSSLRGHRYLKNKALRCLANLLTVDLVQIVDVRLNKSNEDTSSLRRASSGEQCIMVIMLGIAAHIEDYSCILIDEPEISLHPEWQERFVDFLTQAFSNYVGCQFIIATHSLTTNSFKTEK